MTHGGGGGSKISQKVSKRGQFHQRSLNSYCGVGFKSAKYVDLTVIFALSGSVHVKALRKHVSEIDPICFSTGGGVKHRRDGILP